MLGIIAGILIYLSLMLNGQSVAQGVVEEKSSRVVELLLATVRPWQLMAGKVLGIGVVGLLQIVVIGVAGVVAGLATGALTISGLGRGRHDRLAGRVVPARLLRLRARVRGRRRRWSPARRTSTAS